MRGKYPSVTCLKSAVYIIYLNSTKFQTIKAMNISKLNINFQFGNLATATYSALRSNPNQEIFLKCCKATL